MINFFKIIEKIVWVIAALTIVAVLAMVFIGAFANLDKAQFGRSSYITYFYGAAAVVVLYKVVVLYYTSFYQTEIDEKTGMLASLDDEMKRFGCLCALLFYLVCPHKFAWAQKYSYLCTNKRKKIQRKGQRRRGRASHGCLSIVIGRQRPRCLLRSLFVPRLL